METQSGRSMIEMLGILAIIGVLSLGSVAVFNAAMNRHTANNLTYDVMLMAESTLSIGPQEQMPFDASTEYNEMSSNRVNGIINVTVNNIAEDVCKVLLSKEKNNVFEIRDTNATELIACHDNAPTDVVFAFVGGGFNPAPEVGGCQDDNDCSNTSDQCTNGQCCPTEVPETSLNTGICKTDATKICPQVLADENTPCGDNKECDGKGNCVCERAACSGGRLRNEVSCACDECPNENPIWDGTACVEPSCPEGTEFYNDSVDASDPTGDTFDVPVSETDSSLGSMTCMCPSTAPIYHDGQCHACSDFVSGAVSGADDVGEQIPLSDSPLSLSTSQACYCPSTAPDYDTGAGCQSCPDRTVFSGDSCLSCNQIDSSKPVYNDGVCEACPGNSFTISMDESAPGDPICGTYMGDGQYDTAGCNGKEHCYCNSDSLWDETAGTCVENETLVMCDYNGDGYADDGILDEYGGCLSPETYCAGKCQSKYNDWSLTGSFNSTSCDCDSPYGLCDLDGDYSFDGIYIDGACKDCNEYCGSSGSLVQLNPYNGICQCSDMGAM